MIRERQAMNPILTVSHLTYTPPQSAPILQDVSFTLMPGDFCLLYGKSGCGKSTLLRLLKPELTMTGCREGDVILMGKKRAPFPESANERDDSCFAVGFVGQDPKGQIVTDRVWHEMAFGCESMGMKPDTIRARVAELALSFGLTELLDADTATLSGGTSQILNLAAALATDPALLILDEPTSQLDPIAAERFLSLLSRIHTEFGTTILITEHRTEAVLPLANRLLILENGRLTHNDHPVRVLADLRQRAEQQTDPAMAATAKQLFSGMPMSVRISSALSLADPAPLTLPAFRKTLADSGVTPDSLPKASPKPLPTPAKQAAPDQKQAALSLRDIDFSYEKGRPILRALQLDLYDGEILCLMGGNGSGKTTALTIAAGLQKPSSGRIFYRGKRYKPGISTEPRPAYLVQDVTACFTYDTVGQELHALGLTAENAPFPLPFPHDRHPYDLSGGEKQLLALTILLGSVKQETSPSHRPILLLDEPTKGLDRFAVAMIRDLLRDLRRQGYPILIVTHDKEFAAELADRCALLSRGEIVSTADAETFFTQSRFYTTSAHLLTRHLIPRAITYEGAIEALKPREVT